MPTNEEMREWLKKLKRPYEEEIWGRPFEKSCHHDLEIIDAILAALDRPSGEERKEWAELIRDIKNAPDWDWDEDVPPILDKIELFIQGNPAPGKEEK